MEDFNNLSPLALAFLGDAIHTAYVRNEILKSGRKPLNVYNNFAKKFCNAKSQADTLEKLQQILTEEERDIVRKTRNTHNKHSAKNFDEETYKKATCFEALVGWLYLSGKTERMQEILSKSICEEEV